MPKGIYKRTKKHLDKMRKTGFQKGNISWTTGKHLPEEMKRKISKNHIDVSGNNNPNWQGGKSFEIYPQEFNLELKLKIRQRDNFICCLCKRTEREELEELNRVLSVNHIDFDKRNCKENNLNTLCMRCNVKINREREYWTNYFLDNIKKL